MTPPPAATHAAQTGGIGLAPRPIGHPLLGQATARLLEARAWGRVRFLVDVVVLYLASSAALLAAKPIRIVPEDRWLAASFPILVLLVMHARRSPDGRLHGSLLDTGTYVLGVVSLSAMLMISLDSIVGGIHPVNLAVRLWLFAVVYLAVARTVLLSIRRQALRTHALARPTLVVGAGVIGEQLVKRLAGDPRYGMRPVGFLDSDPPPREENSDAPLVPVLGGPDDLADAVAQTGARHVIVAFSSVPDHGLVEAIGQCQQQGIEVSLVPRLYESINERATISHVGGLPLVSLRSVDPHSWPFGVKHAIDRGFALLALVALAPLMAAIAAVVRLTSPGPALFRQRRVGRDGRVFDVLKFRTMRESNCPPEFQLPDGCAPGGIEGEDRRTRIGRLLRDSSLDELPQLINVLRGDMSLVGPRPERPEFVARFTLEVTRYQDRHRVKSGITGWAQVHGLRGQTSIADRVEWDNYYVKNWSLRLDLRIIALTVLEILRFRG